MIGEMKSEMGDEIYENEKYENDYIQDMKKITYSPYNKYANINKF